MTQRGRNRVLDCPLRRPVEARKSMTSQQFIMEVHATLPDRIRRLQELGANLRFSWHRPTRQLLERLDPELWRSVSGNPRLFLRWVDQATLDKAATDEHFLAAYGRALRSFDEYLKGPLPGTFPLLPPGQLVAYFCAEYGFHESFPIYSGGLGILAGDHCKTASDMRLNSSRWGCSTARAISPRRSTPTATRWRLYPTISPRDLPVDARPRRRRPAGAGHGPHRDARRPVRRSGGARGRSRHAWCLLDTNVAGEHARPIAAITHKLYGGDREVRIQQEMVLGIGGVRALRALGLAPTVWHINEGHAAFSFWSCCASRSSAGASFDAALEAVAGASVFTTHTPVAAGHDAFPADVVLRHFGSTLRRLGIRRRASCSRSGAPARRATST